ncbi:MAG TPA: glycoside hydrolase family 76 protein [Tepidisphaeraceae bacterium]
MSKSWVAPTALESLEPRRLLASVSEADLFGAGLTVNVSGSSTSAAFAPANVVDGSNAAFAFNDSAGTQRMSIAGFNTAIHTLRIFDTPSYLDRAAGAVTIYYSRVNQASLIPAAYTLLGTFGLAPVNRGGTSVGDAYPTPTSPADHPRASDPSSNPAATIGFSQLTGLNIPPGARSILLDFGVNPAGLGFGLSEIQAFGTVSPTRAPDVTLLGWGQNVEQRINSSLKVPGSSLYAETARTDGTRSGADGAFSFVWPAATQFRALNALLRIDPATYRPIVRAYADELYNRYWTFSGVGGYRSGVSSGATRFYDDNGHIVVALAEAYGLTGDPVYLTRAIQTYNFVLTGEDNVVGGGIYFSEADHSSKDSISTLQAVRAGSMLYQLTGQSRYLTDAQRLYGWATTHVQQSDGSFVERYKITGPNTGQKDGFALVNSAGIGLSSNLLFYDATANTAYLREAQRIAKMSVGRYFNATTGAINDEGYWAFELVDALDDMYLHDRNVAWLNAVKGAMTWLHNNREDANGHYDTLWGRGGVQSAVLPSWHLNEQASVAQSYLYTAAVNLVASPFVTVPGDPITGFYQASVGVGDTRSTVGSGPGQYLSNEGPAGAIDGAAGTKYLNFGNGNSSTSTPTKGVGTGFYVTPVIGSSIVTGVQVATANDSPNRDPLSVSIEGTNATTNLDAGATWTLIADNVNLGINADPGRQTFGPTVTFPNSTAYRSYRVIIKSQRGSDIGVQYGELNLVGGPDAVPPQVTTTSFEFATAQAVLAQFSEDVSGSLAPDDLLLQNMTTGASIPSTAIRVDWDPQLRQARWTFPGYPAGLPDGNYRATLAAGGVRDLTGNPMTDDATFDFFILAGDANRDRTVDFNDLVLLAQNYNTMGGKTFGQGDFNGDGNVDFNDLVILAQRYNTTLPISSPAAAPVPSLATSRPGAPSVLDRAQRNAKPFSVVPVSPAPRPIKAIRWR